MSWKHWTAVALVIAVGIALGIALQIPRHEGGAVEPQGVEEAPGAAAAPGPATASDVPAGPYRTISLEVTGMT